MKTGKVVYSIRLDEWTANDLGRLAEAQGVPPRLLARQLIEQGISNYNVLAEHMSAESDRLTKALDRLEQIALGHLVVSSVAQKGGEKPSFETIKKAVEVGKKLQGSLNASGEEQEG